MLFAATGEPSTIALALGTWESERVRCGTKPKNARKQAVRLRTFFSEQGWSTHADLTRENIVGALRGLSERGRATATVLTLQCQIDAFCAFLVACGKLPYNPCETIPAPRRPRGATRRRGVRAFTEQEIERIVAAAEADEKAVRPDHAARRSVLYRVAALTGARYGQLVKALAWGDVDLDRGTITFDRSTSKNGHGATLPLHAQAVEVLRAWRERCEVADATDFVFPTTIQSRIIDRDIRAAGVAKRDGSGRPAAFHSFRKSFATALVANGVPVNVAQRLMQHRTVQMTLEIYAEVQESGLIDGLSTLQVFGNGVLRERIKKSSPKEGESVDAGGEIDDSGTHAVRHFSQHESPSPGGLPHGEQHFPNGWPSGDRDFLPRGFGSGVGSPLTGAMGGSSPPLGIPTERKGKEAGERENVSPTLGTLADLLELAAKLLRQTMKGSARDSCSGPTDSIPQG
ncbi:MAG: site-specific integrase [Phycisphaeraceae bacterium]|nr:site-specific integrase [Phycisphaeraceae bacterium]